MSKVVVVDMTEYMDIINGKKGYLAEAKKKWRKRLRKYTSKKIKPIYLERIPN